MKTKQIFTLVAVAMLQLLTGNAQTDPTNATSRANVPSSLSPGATEVAKLSKSGVGDDVVLSFVGQSQSYYNLSAADIAGLKDAGVSSQAMTAMLNHDGALRTQQPSSSPAPSAPSSPQAATITQSGTASATTTPSPTSANTTVVVQPPPPAPQVEVIPVIPGPDYVWTPGWWSWNGGAWIWFGGYWGYPSNTNGVVTLDEWQQFDTNARAKENFNALDERSDGQIHATEFLNQAPKHSKPYHFFGGTNPTDESFSLSNSEEFQPQGLRLFSFHF